jgi:phosphoribosylformimino-5-aminoimidazole carboxamide ribotide isomerase
MQVIPAIDIRGGRCVRLVQGDYARETVFNDDPVAVARRWEAAGAERIHVVDLDGAREGRQPNWEVVRSIAGAVGCPVQTGGGIRDIETLRTTLEGGVEWVIIGTAAVKDPDFLRAAIEEAAEHVIVGVDVRDDRVGVEGWVEATDLDVIEFAERLAGLGVRRILSTDIARDGVTEGPNVDLYRRLTAATSMAVIASGGVTTLDDITRLAETDVESVVVGRALLAGDIALGDAIGAASAAAAARGGV